MGVKWVDGCERGGWVYVRWMDVKGVDGCMLDGWV